MARPTKRQFKKFTKISIEDMVVSCVNKRETVFAIKESGVVTSVYFPDRGSFEAKKFISSATNKLISSINQKKVCSIASFPLFSEKCDFSFERNFFNRNSCQDDVDLVEMIFCIQEVILFISKNKAKAPNLITLVLMTQLITGNSNVAPMNMTDAFEYYKDRRVSLGTKLALVDLNHIGKFRRALRMLLQTGYLVRSIFNTIWVKDHFKETLAKPENGSFSYLPILKPEFPIL